MKPRADWEKYNKTMATGITVGLERQSGSKPTTAISYSHVFLQEHKVEAYFNDDCNKILQLGSADGRYIAEQKEKGWNVKAYDFSEIAIEQLKNKGIPAKKVDLNRINEASNELLYCDQLTEDVSQPVNILLIRILQYLELPALNLLLLTLIDKAAPGSVFVIAGNSDEYKLGSEEFTTRTRQYKSSFFATRTDFELLAYKQVNTSDELLVYRKLPQATVTAEALRSENEALELQTKAQVETLRSTIRSSNHKGEIKLNFISSLSKDVNQTRWCFDTAEILITIIADNKARVEQEYFSSFRDGSKRHDILENKLNEVICTLSHGNLNHAKNLINETIQQLDSSQAYALFTSSLPEVEALKKLHTRLIRGKAVDLQPDLIQLKKSNP